ncbi:deoxyribose-phosphate aldolase [Leptopilina boulardi]|uniref:deoxyribose-phosphate aldolase n=1 Tax=Leptopilina boulardi TaxID=63433 RepID=UPI0021F5A892|nr:deoxyribose-phosphate aldolase [Leptopilina boulardi]
MWMMENHVYLNEPSIKNRSKVFIFQASTLEGNNKLAWLLKAITFIDLTTLGGDDTASNVKALCSKAVNPVSLSFEFIPIQTAAVCVYPSRIEDAIFALNQLNGQNIAVASVAAGFPSGQYPLESRLREIELAVKLGANEIDIVINRSLVLAHRWNELFKELKAMKEICGTAHMKTILAVGELPTFNDVYKASMVAMQAGTDFIKTSTGKETINATLPIGIVMCRAIRDYHRETGRKVGFKPAGGIKTASEALEWMILIKQELGNEWLDKSLFRIGASSLLDDIVKNIDKLIKSNV